MAPFLLSSLRRFRRCVAGAAALASLLLVARAGAEEGTPDADAAKTRMP
jgi:hypothetical protein